MSSSPQIVRSLQAAVWNGSLPLAITLSPADCTVYDKTDTYYIHCPRLSYLPFLLEKIHAFYKQVLIDQTISPSNGWFSFEGVPLKWHHPVGLLYDLFAGAVPAISTASSNGGYTSTSPSSRTNASSSFTAPLPWRLTIHYSAFPTDQLVQLDTEGKAVHDAFINSVKEADFLRNGTANAIMKLNTDDSNALWKAVVDHKLPQFAAIYNRLVPSASNLRHVPIRVYLPASDLNLTEPKLGHHSSSPDPESGSPKVSPQAGHLRVVQALVPPFVPETREQQTLGAALNSLLPALFPSRRRMVLARPVLHGAVLPLESGLEDLLRGAVYADGWLSLGIDMMI